MPEENIQTRNGVPMIKDKALLATLLIFSAIITALIVMFFLLNDAFWFSFLTLLPVSELRGSIPLAFFSYKWPLWAIYPAAILLNAFISPLVFLFLDNLHPLFYKWNFYKRLFDRFILKARFKMKAKVEKFGMIGIMLFVGIPLPITGVYTGTAGAWILGLNRKKTVLASLGGVIISGIIVSTIILLMSNLELPEGIENILNFFIKRPEATLEMTESICL